MRKPIASSLTLIAATLGSMQTPSVAGDCYFNSTTYEPPDFARCIRSNPFRKRGQTRLDTAAVEDGLIVKFALRRERKASA
jgi:hypothetical protein